MGSSGYDEEVFFVELASDSYEACHGGRWFVVLVGAVRPPRWW